MKRFAPLAFALAAVVTSGCSLFEKQLVVEVDGYVGAVAVTPGEYRMAPLAPNVSDTDLRYLAHAAVLEKALATRGWRLATDAQKATTLIKFYAGTSGPVYSLNEYNTPEYGFTGYMVNPVMTPTVVNGQTVMTQSTMMSPTYGQVGVRQNFVERTHYVHRVVIDAYSSPAAGSEAAPTQIWKTIVTATDERNDLRVVLPAMLETAAPSFGKNTDGILDITIPAPSAKRD